MTNYLITGATGIIGSHVLFELLRKKAQGEKIGQIFVCLRESKTNSNVVLRLRNVLTHSGVPYFLKHLNSNDLLNFITPVNIDFAKDIAKKTLVPKNIRNLIVIHCAGSTNLSQTKNAREDVRQNNLIATRNLLNFCKGRIERFVYIGTAFSCGLISGLVKNTYRIYKNRSFRNPYENIKSQCEKTVINYCEKHCIDWQILRPSVVCGRLIDPPLFFTPTFNALYGWAKFFWKFSERLNKESIRIWINKSAGLNIVSADYVAKCIVAAITIPSLKELNIVHSSEVFHYTYCSQILNTLGSYPCEFVDIMPKSLTFIERAYYKTAGSVFGPYVTTEPFGFERKCLDRICNNNGIVEPQIDINIDNLIRYAVKVKFTNAF